jgi:regulator of protease activity HflC (stomatin/prohibitin superfamily)
MNTAAVNPQDGLRQDLKDVGPWAQSVALAFRFLFIAVCVIAAGWFVSNVRQIPADSQGVVMRFGTVVRIHGPGLLIAFPRPIEQIVIVPAPARQIGLRIARFDESQDPGMADDQGFDLARDPRRNAGFLLTGDSNVIHLDAQIFYQVSDPVAFMISGEHVRPALERLLIASAIAVVGRRDLDSILVARPEVAARTAEAAARERFRADILSAVNNRLTALADAGAGLGVTASRVDLVPSIPATAKSGFDNVLVVTQNAETAVATAQTAAQITQQDANSKKDKIATNATASAEEVVTNAKAATASIAALAQQTKDMSRNMEMTRLYYDRVEALLKKAGSVEVLDKDGTAHTILPGVYPPQNRRAN